MREMADDNFTATTFYSSWKSYQDNLQEELAQLTPEQLVLRAGPGMRSVGEIVLHIIGCRVYWFTEYLHEDGGDAMKPYASWNQVALGTPYANWDAVGQALGTSAPTAAELAQGLASTWAMMAECLARWSPAEIRQTFPDVDETGAPVEVSRAWVVWHVLEHDLHHGGEVSVTLGVHGIPAAFAV